MKSQDIHSQTALAEHIATEAHRGQVDKLGADYIERFGAVPFSASNSTLTLVVARPPLTIEDARQVAREHFHFCPYDSQFHGFGGITPYVRKLVGAREWSFWWD